ncbi:MAG: hypothetical protein AAF799_37215 [Myxococcota bacterium]
METAEIAVGDLQPPSSPPVWNRAPLPLSARLDSGGGDGDDDDARGHEFGGADDTFDRDSDRR